MRNLIDPVLPSQTYVDTDLDLPVSGDLDLASAGLPPPTAHRPPPTAHPPVELAAVRPGCIH
jgi:hypothetical protein